MSFHCGEHLYAILATALATSHCFSCGTTLGDPLEGPLEIGMEKTNGIRVRIHVPRLPIVRLTRAPQYPHGGVAQTGLL